MRRKQSNAFELVKYRVVCAIDGVPPVDIAHVEKRVEASSDQLAVVRGSVGAHQRVLVDVEVVLLLARNMCCFFLFDVAKFLYNIFLMIKVIRVHFFKIILISRFLS